MQTKKVSLANIQGKMSRNEMRGIVAGSAPGAACGCVSDSDCPSDKVCSSAMQLPCGENKTPTNQCA